MTRYILTTPVTLTSLSPEKRVYRKGDVVELSAAEVTAVGAGNLRAPAFRDQLGEGTAAANSD